MQSRQSRRSSRGGRVPALDTGLAGVASGAKHLQVLGRVGQIGVRPDGLDMVDLKPPLRAALAALEAVAFQDRHAQHPPPCRAGDCPRKAVVILVKLAVGLRGVRHAHITRVFAFGRAAMRAPSATARIEAAAASTRPLLRAFASLMLFAGSRIVTASAKADRSSSDGRAFTFPSKTARRNRSQSSLPLRKPWPRHTSGARMPARSSALPVPPASNGPS